MNLLNLEKIKISSYYAARRDNTAAKTITTLITHFHTAVASGPLYVHVVNNYVHVVNNS